jgi:hypothetical protein
MSLPFPTNVTLQTPIDFFSYINQQTSYLLGPVTLTCVFMITFISLKTFNASKAFATASWLTALIALPFAILGLIAFEIAVFLLILAFVSVIFIRETIEYD